MALCMRNDQALKTIGQRAPASGAARPIVDSDPAHAIRPDPRQLGPDDETGMNCRILVVDDSRVQRRILAASLARWGYDVVEAATGPEALEIAGREVIDIVVSDWMMPGMDGLEFCRAFRDLPGDRYGYFILLTSRNDKSDVAAGLGVGADDFLAKPVHAAELRARILAGERILRMERELTDKNRLLGRTLTELRDLYDSLDRDLQEARKLQLTLVRERYRDFGAAEVSLLLRPSGHVGGDLVGFFPVGEDRVALFAVDVAGHGVTSAIMAARLAGALSGDSADRNIALRRGTIGAWPPEIVAERLNRLLLNDMKVDHYFTLAYAEVSLSSGDVSLVQAGHPFPVVLRADGRVDQLGNGGLPVGLIPGATWERTVVRLSPGDRLLLTSDGITECPNGSGAELGEEGLAAILHDNRALPGPAFLDALVEAVERHAGGADFPDDISCALFDYRGPVPRRRSAAGPDQVRCRVPLAQEVAAIPK